MCKVGRDAGTCESKDLGANMQGTQVSYRVRHFVFAQRYAICFELVRFTPRSRGGTVIQSRVVHAGSPLSAFRQAFKDLQTIAQGGAR